MKENIRTMKSSDEGKNKNKKNNIIISKNNGNA